jgi:LCP family protein required for cell wall assembly
VLVLGIVIPSSGVRPTTLSLTKVETANGYDVGRDVVWVLVLGADSGGDTDALELLGIDVRTGAAAAIGIPRDSWVNLGGGHMDKINQAYKSPDGAELISSVVNNLVGIQPDYVLSTAGDGFVSMVDALGGVTVDSPEEFTTDDGHMEVQKGPNRFNGAQALDFAMSRHFAGPGDFTRVANHQALLLGLLKELQKRDDHPGFTELMALSAIDGLQTNASPVDLYRLLNALTGVDPAKVKGCLLRGAVAHDPVGGDIILPDTTLGHRLGREAIDDATFESGCKP